MASGAKHLTSDDDQLTCREIEKVCSWFPCDRILVHAFSVPGYYNHYMMLNPAGNWWQWVLFWIQWSRKKKKEENFPDEFERRDDCKTFSFLFLSLDSLHDRETRFREGSKKLIRRRIGWKIGGDCGSSLRSTLKSEERQEKRWWCLECVMETCPKASLVITRGRETWSHTNDCLFPH